jgi:hypothetical protein
MYLIGIFIIGYISGIACATMVGIGAYKIIKANKDAKGD